MNRVFEYRIWDKLLNKLTSFHPWISIDKTLILMQFTGFFDKAGIKIFEGDIVQMMNTHGYYVIEFNQRTGAYTASGFQLNGRFIDTKDLFVRGNIYENPELLTVKR